MMDIPVDYGMCCQTVTVYRKKGGAIERTVIPGCYLHWKEDAEYTRTGRRQERKFLLIQPGQRQEVYPGDRVLEGIGPEITPEEWARFLPVQVPNLGEVAYAEGFYWQNAFCHTEAGRR